MRTLRYILAALAVCMLVLIPAAPAGAERGCIIDALGLKVCGELLGQPLPEVVKVTVTPPPVVIPGPTTTVTVRPQPRPPAPTATRTVVVEKELRVPPTTVFRTPQATPERVPGPTVTVTRPGQFITERDTIGPPISPDPPPGRGFFRPDIDFGDDEVTVSEAGLSLIVLMGIVLAALYAGYVLGYKDSQRKDTNFMRALSEIMALRGKHR